jgi:L-ascorbate metabolism protein UlaG (beta-lactamase superfamily)
MTRKKLSNNVKFHLIYQDDTRFGSAITSQCDSTIRKLCASIIQHRQTYGLRDVIARSRELLSRVLTSNRLGELYSKPDVLLEDWLYPAADRVNPVAVDLERGVGEIVARIQLPTKLSADLAAYLGEWELGATPPLEPVARQLWDALDQLGAIAAEEKESSFANLGNATLIGHSTLRISDGISSILFDPFLLPKADAYPTNYQPLSVRELGRIDAVFITHSHPDHFDLGTLLRLSSHTPIFVPDVKRESVLAIDMAFRLRQLGFCNVYPFRWFDETQIGKIRIVALPFYGEQPTVADVLHPEVRNQGNTYLVEANSQRMVLTADSGTDSLGNIKRLAVEALERYGTIDTLFGGYRGFGLYPVQYLFSSVSRYLPFVPRNSWQVRQQMMCNVDDLIDVAEIWDAKRIIPYSDGGAPWYWMRGLGPCLDGSEVPIMAVDPTPEYVRDVAGCRTGTRRDGLIASPVSICLLRPGDSLIFEEENTRVHHCVWPYADSSVENASLVLA